MRREGTSGQSYIDWLKSLGCVFYAPLTQGDFTDHIGGTTGSPYNDTALNNLQWNSSVGAYRLVSSTWGANPLRFQMIDLQTRWNGALSWTWVMDIRKINYVAFQMIIGYIPNTANNWTNINNNGWPLDFVRTAETSTSQFNRFALTMEYINDTQYHYIRYRDGEIIYDNPNYYQSDNYEKKRFPVNWPAAYFNYVSICSCINPNDHKTDAYIKNCYLFNTALTREQILSL